MTRGVIPGPKRLIICCDGTWMNSATAKPNVPSNVTRICRSLAKSGRGHDGKIWQQIVYYDAGVGTGNLSFFEKRRQGATGSGVNAHVIQAYNFLVNNYVHGDEIFFFGFSRGAYTVRAVAGLVCTAGILLPTEMMLFPALYAIYKADAENENAASSVDEWWQWNTKTLKYLGPRLDIPVKVVGVWDTVASLGLPSEQTNKVKYRRNYLFHKTQIHSRIENAFHGLALDERRGPFSPILWHIPPDNKTTNLMQVWFPGGHINVGGGDPEALNVRCTCDHEEIAHIAFAWMVDRVSEFLAFDKEATFYSLHVSEGKEETEPGLVDNVRYASGQISNSFKGLFYRLLGVKLRTPGEYCKTSKKDPTQLICLGPTNEYIHPSVYCRHVGTMVTWEGKINPNPYISKGLPDYTRVKKGGEEGWYWHRPEINRTTACCCTEHKPEMYLQEFVIPTALKSGQSMERTLMESRPGSTRLLKELDRGNEPYVPGTLSDGDE